MLVSSYRITLALAIAATAGLRSLPAQTTPTERAAAGAVLKTIDSLQTAIAPTGM